MRGKVRKENPEVKNGYYTYSYYVIHDTFQRFHANIQKNSYSGCLIITKPTSSVRIFCKHYTSCNLINKLAKINVYSKLLKGLKHLIKIFKTRMKK